MGKHEHQYRQRSLDPRYLVCACGALELLGEVRPQDHDLCVWCMAQPKRSGRNTCSEACDQARWAAQRKPGGQHG